MIQGNGQDSANIMLVGDYPHKEDLSTGQALSGEVGRTLSNLFNEAGGNFNACYRTLFIKEFVKDWGKSRKQKKEELERIKASNTNYEHILSNEIITYKPNVIVPLGDLSLRYLTGYQPIHNYRGSILPLNPLIQKQLSKTIRVIPTLSPQHVWKIYKSRYYVILDLAKAWRNRERQDSIERAEMVWVCKSVSALNEFLKRQPRNPEFITFDIETYFGFPTCISLCYNGEEAISIPFHDHRIDEANSFLMWDEVANILASPIPKVNQNIKYDSTILERFGFKINNIIGDTVLGFHLIYPELPKNLGFQTSIYTDIPYFKDESKQIEDSWNPKAYTKDTLYLYNAKDALATWQIHKKQLEELKEIGLSSFYKDRIMPLFFIYREIDRIGIRVDNKRRAELNAKYRVMYDMNKLALKELLSGDEINPRSPKQVGKLIYEVLKYPVRYKTSESSKNYKTDKDTLDDLIILHGLNNRYKETGKKILSLIILLRKISKIIELINTPLHPGDILKTSYNLAGTETGRTSAGKTLDTWCEYNDDGSIEEVRLGRSLQTIAKHGFEVDGEIYDSPDDIAIGADIRSMFVPRRGKIFIEGDLSQAESRVVAVLANDMELLESHDKKPKVHSKTAGVIFNLDPLTITKEGPSVPNLGMTYYDLGKRVRHASNYLMGPFRLAQMTHLSIVECTRIMQKFKETNPSIFNIFHASIDRALRRSQKLITPFGRKRDFFDRYSEKMLKEGCAYIPQSTVSDYLKFGMIPLYDKTNSFTNFLVESHDSLLSEVDIDRKSEYCDLFRECIEAEIDFTQCTLSRDIKLKIPCELSEGENWMIMKEIN